MSFLDVRVKLSDGKFKEAELVKTNSKTCWVRLRHRNPLKGMNYIKVRKDRIHA